MIIAGTLTHSITVSSYTLCSLGSLGSLDTPVPWFFSSPNWLVFLSLLCQFLLMSLSSEGPCTPRLGPGGSSFLHPLSWCAGRIACLYVCCMRTIPKLLSLSNPVQPAAYFSISTGLSSKHLRCNLSRRNS